MAKQGELGLSKVTYLKFRSRRRQIEADEISLDRYDYDYDNDEQGSAKLRQILSDIKKYEKYSRCLAKCLTKCLANRFLHHSAP
jgi:hypothetical protein